jgi:uncharacterized Rmd1/YagE family protein
MNDKKCKYLRRIAALIAGDRYDVKLVYKSLKKMEKNKDAFLNRLRMKTDVNNLRDAIRDEYKMAEPRVASDKSLELSSTVLEGTNGSNT